LSGIVHDVPPAAGEQFGEVGSKPDVVVAAGVQLAPQPAFGAIAIEIDRDDAET